MPDGYEAGVNETLRLKIQDTCCRSFCSQIKCVIEFWKVNNPDYHALGVRPLSEQEQHDDMKFFFRGAFSEDLVYTGLNVKFVLHFLVTMKKKEDGKLKSFTHMRKFWDAIKWGSEIACQPLPQSFWTGIDAWLAGFKKEHATAKKEGNINDMAADPIPVELYKSILQWALDANNVLVWFWTISQWNFMARSISIDPLVFHNFTVASDSIVGKYDDSKTDKAGERLSEKKSMLTLTIGQCVGGWVSESFAH